MSSKYVTDKESKVVRRTWHLHYQSVHQRLHTNQYLLCEWIIGSEELIFYQGKTHKNLQIDNVVKIGYHPLNKFQ